jgi:uncharacterized delta-60 repeat protein
MRMLRFFGCLFGAASMLLGAMAAHAAAGDLDVSFGTGGVTITDFAGLRDEALHAAVQPDGRIVAVGSTNVLSYGSNFGQMDFALARYLPDGSLDPSFGSGGKVTTHIDAGFITVATGVAIASDGKILVCGYSDDGSFQTSTGHNVQFVLMRYLANGSLDPAFGSAGIVSTAFGIFQDVAMSMVVQADGKIVLAGSTYTAYTSLGPSNFALARYNTDGSLDASFGNAGKVTAAPVPNSLNNAMSLAIDASGRLVAGGLVIDDQTQHFVFGMARFTASGVLDTSFGTGGTVRQVLGSADYPSSVLIALTLQSDGKIVAAGRGAGGSLPYAFMLARYLDNGALDTGFGTSGHTSVTFGAYDSDAYSVAIDSKGAILVGGQTGGIGFYTVDGLTFQIDSGAPAAQFALARLLPNGTLDNSFGSGGKITTRLPNDAATASAIASIVPTTSGIVVAGLTHNDVHAMSTYSSNDNFVVARYQDGYSGAASGVNLDQRGLTGAWYNPATGGQGLLLDVAPDLLGAGQGLLFGGWFTFDVAPAGGADKQRWYTLQGAISNTNPVATIPIYAVTGGNFNAPPVPAPGSRVGTATFLFSDCTHASFSYTFSDGSNRSGTIPLTKLSANVTCSPTGDNGAALSDYALAGTFYDPALSGQGMLFDVSPSQNILFAAWYTFAPDGATTGGPASQRWYTLQAAFTPGISSLNNLPIYTQVGGIFNDPTTPTSSKVGTATLTYASCSAATVQYTFSAGSNQGQTGTVHLSRLDPVPVGCSF